MDSVLIIGAGAAGSVTAQKCAMNRDVFKKVHLASRRIASCEAVAKRCKTPIEISQVDADNVKETVKLLKKVKPDLVMVTTVDNTHDEFIVKALKAGIDVVTEKPMTTTAAMSGSSAPSGRAASSMPPLRPMASSSSVLTRS